MTKAWNWQPAVVKDPPLRQYRILLVDIRGQRTVETIWAPDRARAEEHAITKHPRHYVVQEEGPIFIGPPDV